MNDNKVLWFTGLSGSGKTTIAKALKGTLHNAVHIDGDVTRAGLCSDLGFTIEDRNENIRRVTEITKILHEAGHNVIVSFISPTRKMRQFARDQFEDGDFFEICLTTPMSVCKKRDPKGLYAKVKQGLIKNFTGIDSSYEMPQFPEFAINTAECSVGQACHEILNGIQGTHEYLKCKFEEDTKTAIFIGRFQPPHDGHFLHVETLLNEGKRVLIGLRDIPNSENNPYGVEFRKEKFQERFGDKVDFFVISETSTGGLEVVYGRKVGWDIREVRFDKKIENLSATEIRNKQ